MKKTITILKGFPLEDGFLMVYIRFDKEYQPLASLEQISTTTNLKDAVLVPLEQLGILKDWANDIKHLCEEYNYTLQIRTSNDKETVLHQVN